MYHLKSIPDLNNEPDTWWYLFNLPSPHLVQASYILADLIPFIELLNYGNAELFSYAQHHVDSRLDHREISSRAMSSSTWSFEY
jgi:hypothetical protein